jgi:hypothetical protein
MFEGVTHVVRLSSSIGQHCQLCSAAIGYDEKGLATEINHYITEHGCRLLHIGQETSRDDKGSPWQSTVAFLGC